jgi:hypothetical protein
LAIRRLAIIFALLLGSGFAFSAPQLPCASAAQYRALLAQVEQRSQQPDVSLAELADALPAQCDFMAAGQTFHLSNFQMQRELREIAAEPADIVGTNVFDARTADFRVHRGPLFTELLLVDEINRMPPRTQAALLEAMEERQATIDGVSYPLPPYFTVFATQNPIEFEGTYPLPEAQLDRFLLKAPIHCTFNILQAAGDCQTTRKYAESGHLTGDFAGEE